MYSKEMRKDEPNLDVKFQYALMLIKSRNHTHNHEGLTLLQGARSQESLSRCSAGRAAALYQVPTVAIRPC